MDVARPIPVNGTAFASHPPGGDVAILYVFPSSREGEVDGLGNGVVAVFLKRSLHGDVVVGRKVHGSDKNVSEPFWELAFDVLESAVLNDLAHNVAVLGNADNVESGEEMTIDVGDRLALEDVVPLEGHHKVGFDTSRNVVGHRDSSCGSDSG